MTRALPLVRGLPKVGGFGGGAFAWTLTEYVFHRVAMHNVDKVGPAATEHDRHHRDPYETNPLARTALYAAVLTPAGVIGRHLLGRGRIGLASAVAGWGLGFMGYEQFHWLAHHRPPRTAWGRALRRRHFAHHFGKPRSNFGVTTGIWDRVFGTEIPETDAVRIPTRLAMPWATDAEGRLHPEYTAEYAIGPVTR